MPDETQPTTADETQDASDLDIVKQRLRQLQQRLSDGSKAIKDAKRISKKL